MTPAQEKLLKLIDNDLEQLRGHISQINESRSKSIANTQLDTAVLWISNAIHEVGVKENTDG